MNRRLASPAPGHSAFTEEDSAAAIGSWLESHGLRALGAVRLVGDVSSRSYWRVELAGESTSWIVARYPREMAEAQRRFAAAGALLERASVRVPELRLDDPGAGCALLEDLGPSTLFEAVRGWEEAPLELAAAMRAASTISQLDSASVAALGSPPLDAELMRSELARTQALLLAPAGLDKPELTAALDVLCDRLGKDLVPCHRDFMARNLMPVGGHEVGVLDYQDLRLGPVGYDVASLLNDSLFADENVEARVVAASADVAGDPEQYRRAVVQRSLKAVGTYLAFARGGKRRHLPLVAPTLERALRFFPELPETAPLGRTTVDALLRAGAAAGVC